MPTVYSATRTPFFFIYIIEAMEELIGTKVAAIVATPIELFCKSFLIILITYSFIY